MPVKAQNGKITKINRNQQKKMGDLTGVVKLSNDKISASMCKTNNAIQEN